MADVMVYGSLLKVSHRPSAKANEKKNEKKISKNHLRIKIITIFAARIKKNRINKILILNYKK